LDDLLPRFAAGGGHPGDPPGAAFVRLGEYWSLAYGGTTVLLRDAKGLHYLAELLRHAGEKVSVAALAADAGAPAEPKPADHIERARSAVTKRIRDALQKIEKSHAVLGRHLSARVKTGYECIYAPDPDHPVVWQL
jgi:hypothetical protein